MSEDPVDRRVAEVLSQIQSLLDSLVETQPLTGLPNKRAFDRRLAAAEPGGHIAVLSVDLDGLKNLNTSHGHAGGDMILRELGRRLSQAIDNCPGAMLFHLSGDEFAVLVTGPDRDEVDRLAGAIKSTTELQPYATPGGKETAPGGVTLAVGWAYAELAGTEQARAAVRDKADLVVEFLKATGRTSQPWAADDALLAAELSRFAVLREGQRRRVVCPMCGAVGYLNLAADFSACEHGRLVFVDEG